MIIFRLVLVILFLIWGAERKKSLFLRRMCTEDYFCERKKKNYNCLK